MLTRLPRAKCRGLDPELFFGHDHTEALSLCAACPERTECRDLHREEPHGVFGGTTPADRGFGSYHPKPSTCRTDLMGLFGQSPNCWFRREFIGVCLPGYSHENTSKALARLVRAGSVVKREVLDGIEFKAA